MTRAAKPAGETMSGRAACRRLGISHHQLLKYAALGRIRTKAIPGSPIKYDVGDVDRLASETSAAAK